MNVDDNTLWWWMVGFAFAAAVLSIGTNVLDRRNVGWPGKLVRHRLHITSYMLTSFSILIFIARGFMLP